ncbi:MAG TPA: hypothetical protein VD886_19805 [Herpetosiphonaceae bacterium]|nr:hypothetical protein [Herpetosiphonaceae bacterium]
MTIPRPRRHIYPIIWLAVVALTGTGFAGSGPSLRAANRTQADPSMRTVPCRSNVYPIVLANSVFTENLPAWYQPVTLASIGLPPDAENSAIPALNTATPQSPRFRAGTRGLSNWVVWITGWDYDSAPLIPMLTGAGNLSEGFQELPNASWLNPSYPTAPANNVLDAGDWVAINDIADATPLAELTPTLDFHIAQKTLMILPVFDAMEGQDLGQPAFVHIKRFIQVRLLDYNLNKNEGWLQGYLEFALVDDNKTCLATAALYIPLTAQSAPPPAAGR